MLKLITFFLPLIARAQGTPSRGTFFRYGAQDGNGNLTINPSSLPNQQGLPNPLRITTLAQLLEKVLTALTVLAVPVVTAMVLWGAFKIIISSGESDKVKEGGKIILWACVGFGILLLANGAVAIVESLFK